VFIRAQGVYGTDCCAIARLLDGRSCREVASRLAALRASGQAIGEASARELQVNRKWSRSRSSKKVLSEYGRALFPLLQRPILMH